MIALLIEMVHTMSIISVQCLQLYVARGQIAAKVHTHEGI